MKYENPQLIDALAAEYVLGTLHGRARLRFERLLLNRSKIRKAVAAWETRLNKLVTVTSPVPPPKQVWQGIEQSLFPPPPAAEIPWHERLVFWRGVSFGSTGLAAVLALLLVVMLPSQPPPSFVVVLNDKAEQPVWTVSTSSDMDKIHVVNLKPMQIGPQQGCMLWVQAQELEQYYPVGLLPDDGSSMQLPIADEIRKVLRHGKLLVTIEDKTQPTPAVPSSAVEFSGRLAPLTKI